MIYMENLLSKEELLALLDSFYKQTRKIESNGKFSSISKEILKIRNSLLSPDKYYKLSTDRESEIICYLLLKYKDDYEELSRVFKSKEAAMIINIIDAKLPPRFGETMEKIFYDDDYIIGIHGTIENDYVIEKEFFSKGLLCNYGPVLNRTVKTKDDGLDFYSFLQYEYVDGYDVNAVIIRISRDEFDNGIWKEIDYKYYLNPKYIYGYYKSHYATSPNESPRIIKNSNYGRVDFSYNILDKEKSSYQMIKA